MTDANYSLSFRSMSPLQKPFPHSPRKRLYVVDAVVERCMPNQSSLKSKAIPSRSIDAATEESVKAFFEEDSVSRMALGVKDVIRVKENGIKTEYQKVSWAHIKYSYTVYTSIHAFALDCTTKTCNVCITIV